jgi:ABC-type oligopeptide transport system substrate-binding subunit
MRQLRRIAVVALVTVALFALAGCDTIAKKAVEKSTGVKVNDNNSEVTVTDKNGATASMSSKEGKLPDGLPDDVPAYSGTIKGSATMQTPDGTNYTFSVETKDDPTTVVSWYKDKLAAKGWTISSTVASGDSAMIGAEKGDKNKLAVTIGRDSSSDMTVITVVNSVTK